MNESRAPVDPGGPVVDGMIGQDVRFERIRRITGYLVGTVDRFNNAKRAEEHDRVKHITVTKKWEQAPSFPDMADMDRIFLPQNETLANCERGETQTQFMQRSSTDANAYT